MSPGTTMNNSSDRSMPDVILASKGAKALTRGISFADSSHGVFGQGAIPVESTAMTGWQFAAPFHTHIG